MENICKNFEKCPIYTGVLKDKVKTTEAYKKIFCNAGKSGWSACRRFQVKEKTGKCPPDLMPNSIKDADTIIAEMNLN